MESARYKPGEAVRWLQEGAEGAKKSLREKGRSITQPDIHHTFSQNVRAVAGALLDMGKGAMAEIAHRQAMAREYSLGETAMEVIQPGSAKVVPYDTIRRLEQRGDRTTVITTTSRFVIRPYAYIVAGRLKVPIGWERNGMEVPYELIIEELSARCGLDLEEH
ncbi:MAG: hypothetical protein JSS72_00370 [Armatimonadetes bacterium]|nr:hypothetical protein [Armatimonadota bacterium]